MICRKEKKVPEPKQETRHTSPQQVVIVGGGFGGSESAA